MQKFIRSIIYCLVFSLFLTCCTGCTADKTEERIVYAMDTVITMRIPKTAVSAGLLRTCEQMIRNAESVLSRTVTTSKVSSFNTSDQGVEIDKELYKLLSLSLEVSSVTDGAFDITCEPLSQLWNISASTPSIPEPEKILSTLDSVGYQKISLKGNRLEKNSPEVRIDLGGVGKGYALGAVVEYLAQSGVCYGTVSFGGNIGLIGSKPDGEAWKVGVKDPRNPEGIVGTLSLDGGYVAVSGDYERYFEKNGIRYHHILDPRTGYPADSGIQSVAVMCEDATLADALSTALFVLGYEESQQLYNAQRYDFEAVFVTQDGIMVTDGLTNRFVGIDR